MIRFLTLSAFLAAALAADPAPPPAEVVWAGIPLTALPDLGLGEPTLDARSSSWQAPLAGGGWVRASVHGTVAEAVAALDMALATSSTSTAPPDDTWQVTRAGNVVFVVRAPEGGALGLVARLEAALVPDAPRVPIHTDTSGPAPVAWDAYGRLVAP